MRLRADWVWFLAVVALVAVGGRWMTREPALIQTVASPTVPDTKPADSVLTVWLHDAKGPRFEFLVAADGEYTARLYLRGDAPGELKRTGKMDPAQIELLRQTLLDSPEASPASNPTWCRFAERSGRISAMLPAVQAGPVMKKTVAGKVYRDMLRSFNLPDDSQ
jgi:hypothetical protein